MRRARRAVTRVPARIRLPPTTVTIVGISAIPEMADERRGEGDAEEGEEEDGWRARHSAPRPQKIFTIPFRYFFGSARKSERSEFRSTSVFNV